MKKNDYTCPKCKGHLNAGGYVIFNTKNNRKKQGLILLSPSPGSYSFQHHENYKMEKGELIEFSCPLCHSDLKSKKNTSMVGITMIDHNNIEYDVMFSRKVGEHSTYIAANEGIEMFGEDAMSLDYDDFV